MAGNELATAYVNVVAKMDGGSLSIIRKDVEGSGDESGDAFGKFLANAAVKTIKLIAASKIAKAIGDVVKSAVDAYATFEQVSDGAQDVFDDLDPSRLAADADNAWKTMGMSANGYYEMLTNVGAAFAATMGDEKAYEMASRGMEAIADYAAGSGKSMDELTAKYQMISRSTASYQSIADQFSGILPQTSADFLAQAQAAGLLSDSYTSLTEVPVAEYQEALIGMFEKGNDTLGWTGKQAAEALGTIEGSMTALRNTWQNWLVAVAGGGDVEAKTAELVGSIENVAANVVPRVLTVLGTLAGQIIPTALQYVQDGLPQMLDAGGELFGQIAAAIPVALPQIAQGVVDLVVSLAEYIGSHLPDILAAAVTMLGGIALALGSVTINVLQGLGKLADEAIAAIGGAAGGMLVAGREWLASINEAAGEKIGELLDFMGKVPDKILAALGDTGKVLYNAGKAIIDGFLNGLKATWGNVTDFVGGIADWIAANKGPLPYDAKLLVPAGRAIMGGFERSLRDGYADVQDFVSGIGGDVQANVRASVSGGVSGGSDAQLLREILAAVQSIDPNVYVDGRRLAYETASDYDTALGRAGRRASLAR